MICHLFPNKEDFKKNLIFQKYFSKNNFENFPSSKKMWECGSLEEFCLKFLFVDVIKFLVSIIWDVNFNHWSLIQKCEF